MTIPWVCYGKGTVIAGEIQESVSTCDSAATAVFALGHVQYALSPAIVEIFIVGLALGWLRERANTTTCIAVHASYNLVDALLLPYLP